MCPAPSVRPSRVHLNPTVVVGLAGTGRVAQATTESPGAPCATEQRSRFGSPRRLEFDNGERMPNYWILKTEPSTYSFDQLEREKTAVWDGVKNNLALKHIRQMTPGDRVLIYHTGDEKAVVGMADVVSVPYPDPKKNDPKLVVVDLKAGGAARHARAARGNQVRAGVCRHGPGEDGPPVGRAGDRGAVETTAPAWRQAGALICSSARPAARPARSPLPAVPMPLTRPRPVPPGYAHYRATPRRRRPS